MVKLSSARYIETKDGVHSFIFETLVRKGHGEIEGYKKLWQSRGKGVMNWLCEVYFPQSRKIFALKTTPS